RAIYRGEVDAVLVGGPEGEQIFTLRGAETPYRLLVEAINEGALTLISDGTVLYCNNRFAQMIQRPMEQITGATWNQFFAASEQETLRRLLENASSEGSKSEFALANGDGSRLAVEISVHPLKLDDL